MHQRLVFCSACCTVLRCRLVWCHQARIMEVSVWAVRALLRPGAVLVVLLLVLLLVLAASWCRRYARFRRLELAMPGPRSLPVIGSALKLINVNEDNALHTMLDLWGGRFSELSRFAVFDSLFVFVTDPDHIAKVLRNPLSRDKAEYVYPFLSEVSGQGLLTLNGAHWKRHRTLIQPAFNEETFNTVVNTALEEAGNVVDRLRPLAGKDAEYTAQLYRCFAYSFLRSNVSNSSQRDKEDFELMVCALQKALQAVMIRFLRPWLWPSVVFQRTVAGREQTKFNKLASKVVGRIHEQFAALKEERMRRLTDVQTFNFKERRSLADSVLQTELSQEDAVSEIKTVGGAAIETSSMTLAFTIKILSMYPKIQQTMYDEICDVINCCDNGLLSAADLPRLKYMDRVLKETLRMFPPLPFVARNVSEETEICGKTIPAYTTLFINIFGLHRDPRHHADPLKFDPDRFLPENTAGRHPYCYLPFSAGPRNCIGKQLAMMQMKAVLATLLRAYSVHPVHDGIIHPSQIPISSGLTLVMLGSVKVRFEPRSLDV